MKKRSFLKKIYRYVQKMKRYFDPLYITLPAVQIDLGRKS